MPYSQYLALTTNHVVYCDTAQQKKRPRADSTVNSAPMDHGSPKHVVGAPREAAFFPRESQNTPPLTRGRSCPLITRARHDDGRGLITTVRIVPYYSCYCYKHLSDSPQPSQSGRPFCQVWRFGGRSDFTRTDSALVLPRLRQASSGDQSCDM